MTEKMKPSGIAWIGDIPQDWECKRFRFCGDVQYGYPFNSDYFSNEETGFPLIRIRDITSGEIATYYEGAYPDEYIVKSGDVLVGMDGDFNVRVWEKCDALLNQRCCRVLDNQQISKRFMAYYLPHYLKVINDLTWSTTVKHLLADDINNIYVSYPQMFEQQAIADFLDAQCAKIDSVITDIEKQIETLQKYKKSLIIEAVTKGCIKAPKTKTVRLDFADEINEAWIETRVKYLCSMYSGDNLTSSDIEPEGDYPVYGGNGLRGFYATYTNDGEHVLIGRQGALCGNVHLVSGKFWATDHAVVTYPYEGMCNGYLYYLFSAMDLNQYSQTAAQPGLAVTTIQNLSTCIPPTMEIQQEIAKYLDDKCGEIDSIIGAKQKQLEIMGQHKKSLIYEYVTGKKRVTEVN